MDMTIEPIRVYLEGYRKSAEQHYSDLLNAFFAEAPRQTALRRFLHTGHISHQEYDNAIKSIKEFNDKLTVVRKVDGDYKSGFGKPYTVAGPWAMLSKYANNAYSPAKSTWDRDRMEKDIAHDLEKDMESKYRMIVQRAESKVGEITDATALEVGLNGELNGIVVGKNGRCSIKTVAAGGYNVQCSHFRVLVRKV